MEKPFTLSVTETRVSLLLRLSDPRQRVDAWNVFVNRYANLIYAWCRHWGVDPVTEEDVLQETMVRVLNTIDFFERRRTGSFRLWLKTLAHSSWSELQRQKMRQLANRDATDKGKVLWNGPTSKQGYDHLTELCDAWATQEILDMAAIRVRDRVGESTWMTYVMLAYGHRTIEQVTESIGISAEQAYNRLFRVRRYLKQEYDLLDGEGF